MFDRYFSFGLLGGRVLLSLIFIMSGFTKITNWSGTAQSMAEHGMVMVPFFLAAAIVVELGGGLAVLLGFETRWAALLLAAFLVPVTLVFHNFWAYQGGEMMNQMQHFMKNLTILGGLLTLSAAGAGRFALDETLFHWSPNRKGRFAPRVPA